MHGLINKSIQCFLRDTYGEDTWSKVVMSSNLGFQSFEALMLYEDIVTVQVVDAASLILSKPRAEVLEDLGTYLVTHENLEPIRRLSRIGGDTFVEFLHSREE